MDMTVFKSKKIGIVTFHNVENYGAALQVYSLSKWLSDNGADVEVINYNPDFLPPKCIRVLPNITHITSFRKYIRIIENNLLKKIRQHQFSLFRKKNLKMTAPFNEATFFRNSKKYDLAISGSDQVWNPEITGGKYDDIYFLSTINANKKISYAASFGSMQGIKNDPDLISKIQNLNKVSLREENMCDLLEKTTGKIAECVVDPVLLYRGGIFLRKKIKGNKKKYLLVYQLSKDNDLIKISSEIASSLGLKIKVVSTSAILRKILDFRYPHTLPGIEKFVDLFKEASFVITNSFHGTILSVKYNKQFISVGLKGNVADRNIRMTSFLDKIGLADRFLPKSDSIEIRKLTEEKINYRLTNKIVDDLILHSENYLYGWEK
jgi:hypothetical protein